MLTGCDCVPSPVAAASCPVEACCAPPSSSAPACEVSLPFPAPTPTTATFDWEIAPLFPGLSIRTEMTMLVGESCVATPFAAADWSVVAVWAGISIGVTRSSAAAVPATASGYNAQIPATRPKRARQPRRRRWGEIVGCTVFTRAVNTWLAVIHATIAAW